MPRTPFQQYIAAMLVAVLLTASFATLVTAAPGGAVATQETPLRATTVQGTIPGGEFAEIWLDLETKNIGETITLLTEWNTYDLGGLNFYVLDAGDRAAVVSGTPPRDANVSAGNPVRDAGNQQNAAIRATAQNYTVIVKNESNNDAMFTLSVTNGTLIDSSGNVVDPTAPVSSEDTADEDAVAEDAVAEDAVAEDAVAEDTTTAETATTETATTETAAITETVESDSSAAVSESGVVSAKELSGELPNQDDQHYFGLEPSVKDGTIKLLLSYEPQDKKELSRRLNFWVLNEEAFKKYQDGSRLSAVATAAGSTNNQTADNERVAEVDASGLTPFTVIVYNSSTVPAEYTLTVDGGLLIDDSGQSKTAAAAVAAPEAVTEEDADAAAATTAPSTDTTTTAAETAPASVSSDAGETYTVQAGDTLSKIALSVYGDINAYTVICEKNQVPDCNVIEVGDTLVLPTEAEVAAGTAEPVTAPAASTAPTTAPTVEVSEEITSSTELTTTAPISVSGSLSETATISDTVTSTETVSSETSTNTIVDVLTAEGNFKNLLASLEAAELLGALNTEDPLTLFAPTDAAFAELPEGAVTQLLADPSQLLTQILLYHVLASETMSSDLTDGLEAVTLQGKPVKFEVTDDGIAINGATISKADMKASNGVVHQIDAIILPPQ